MQLFALRLTARMADFLPLASNRALRLGAKVGVSGVVSSKVPIDQWISEVVAWESFTWAILQTAISDYATGWARVPAASEKPSTPNEPGSEGLCKAQKMRKTGGFQ